MNKSQDLNISPSLEIYEASKTNQDLEFFCVLPILLRSIFSKNTMKTSEVSGYLSQRWICSLVGMGGLELDIMSSWWWWLHPVMEVDGGDPPLEGGSEFGSWNPMDFTTGFLAPSKRWLAGFLNHQQYYIYQGWRFVPKKTCSETFAAKQMVLVNQGPWRRKILGQIYHPDFWAKK